MPYSAVAIVIATAIPIVAIATAIAVLFDLRTNRAASDGPDRGASADVDGKGPYARAQSAAGQSSFTGVVGRATAKRERAGGHDGKYQGTHVDSPKAISSSLTVEPLGSSNRLNADAVRPDDQ